MENEATLLAGVNQANTLIDKSVKESQPKFAGILSVGFTYVDGGRWHRIEVNFLEYMEIMRTGHIDDKPICAVVISENEIENDKGFEEKVRVVYDFVLFHQGKNPWRLL